MNPLTKVIITIIALEHLYILWLEMFAWTSKGPKAFPAQPKNTFQTTKVLAANQGLYNGFLAAGLIWSLLINNAAWSQNIATFFLICIITAGIYGSATVERKILFIQALPAVITLVLILTI